MASVSTYLNFARTTEQAFVFYHSIFGGELALQRFADMPDNPGQPPLSDADKQLVMHAELTILNGYKLMGTDAPESMGFNVVMGNNVIINLDPDTRAETERLFNALAVSGKIEMPLQDMFWGAYFGYLTDQFGLKWMFNCSSKD